MSYKYGLNGNDINWSFLETANQKCNDCKQREEDICEGHTTKYSKRGWSLYHDTNDNFVRVVGNIPMEVYSTQYLTDWFEDIYTEENVLNRIFKELLEREEKPKVIASWVIANTASLNVYLTHDSNVEYVMYVGINEDIPKLVTVLSEPSEENDEDIQNYINFHGSKYYLNECLKL